MLCELFRGLPFRLYDGDVLILLLMEYALWAFRIEEGEFEETVLILLLMEYALWGNNSWL